MANVTSGERRPPRGNDAGDFDAAEIDGPAGCSPFRCATCRFLGRLAVEGENSSLEIIFEDATERLTELPSAASGREQLEPEMNLEDGHRCSPN